MSSRQTSTRTGHYVQQPTGYKAFIPADFPPRPDEIELDSDLLLALGRADRALARLDGAASVMPDVDLFITMHIFQEATLSSQIEGTQATVVDVLELQADVGAEERRDAVNEILNYVAALRHGLSRMRELPISLRLVREIHRVLMQDVRGGEAAKTPGDFRTTQNWIGGTSPTNARFVPPPPEEMWTALDQWEKCVHMTDRFPPLVHIGLLHAQFETIHPFLDGNGRVGRLLITFLLTEREILIHPLLYLSIFLREHQDEYYARLQATRDDGDWEGWLSFFIEGVDRTAREATSTVREILQLRERDRRSLDALGRKSGNALKLLDSLFSQPIVTVKTVEKILDVTQPTANSLVADLGEMGLLEEITGQRRNRVFAYSEYLDLFRKAATLE